MPAWRAIYFANVFFNFFFLNFLMVDPEANRSQKLLKLQQIFRVGRAMYGIDKLLKGRCHSNQLKSTFLAEQSSLSHCHFEKG